ncbi:MAG: hypothetical protein ACLFUG_03380 [Nitriliruptoraceae bacterium]
MLFKGNRPPKRHQVQVRSTTGQRTIRGRYVRLDGVRVTAVDRDAGTITVRPAGATHLQIDADTFDAEVASHLELLVSLDGLGERTRRRLLHAAETGVDAGPVALLLDDRRGRLG